MILLLEFQGLIIDLKGPAQMQSWGACTILRFVDQKRQVISLLLPHIEKRCAKQLLKLDLVRPETSTKNSDCYSKLQNQIFCDLFHLVPLKMAAKKNSTYPLGNQQFVPGTWWLEDYFPVGFRPIFRGLLLGSVIRDKNASNEEIAIEMWTLFLWFGKLHFFVGCQMHTVSAGSHRKSFDVLTFMCCLYCVHPPKINMEPENAPLEIGNTFKTTQFLGSMLVLGCTPKMKPDKNPKAWSDVVGACHTSSLLEIITSSGWKRSFSRHSFATKKNRPFLLATATLAGGGNGLVFVKFPPVFFVGHGWKVGCEILENLFFDPGTRNDGKPAEVFHCAAFRLLAEHQGLDF